MRRRRTTSPSFPPPSTPTRPISSATLRSTPWTRGASTRRQRDQILEHIREQAIRKAVIVSGDVHASMSSELRLAGDPDFKIVSIVSSAFFWPYPHPRERDFHLSGKIETRTGQPYRVANGSRVQANDNFTLLKVEPEKIRVQVFERKGKALGTKTHNFG